MQLSLLREDDLRASLTVGACLGNFLSIIKYVNDLPDMDAAARLEFAASLKACIREVPSLRTYPQASFECHCKVSS